MLYLPHETARLLELASTRDHITGCGDVFKLEGLLKKHYGKRYALCVNNATTAMLATVLATDLRGSEIIASPFSWPGTLGALGQGSSFVLSTVDPLSLNMDPESLSACLDSRTRAVVSTDFGGAAAPHEAISAFCKAQGLLYISDSACSMGAYDEKGRGAGSLADVVIVSFTEGKSVQAGEGAAIITDHRHIYDRLLQVCQHPERQRKELGSFAANEFAPLNARMHPLATHLLVRSWDHQLDRLRDRQERIARFLIGLAAHSVKCSMFSGQPRLSTYFDLMLPFDAAKLPEEHLSAATKPKPVTARSSGTLPLQWRVPSKVADQLAVLETTPYLRLNELLKAHPAWQYC